MSTTNRNFVLRLTSADDVHLQTANGDRTLSEPESFAMGYSLHQDRKHDAAAQVFAALVRRHPSNTDFLMMLARCRAGLKDYPGCSEILQALFAEAECETVARLQAVFVFESLGQWDDAIGELRKVAESHPQMPLLRLFLADFYAHKGNPDSAAQCWKSALESDGQDGCVAFVAQRQLQLLTRRTSAVQETNHA